MRTGRPTKYRKDFPERAERLFSRGATSAEVARSLKIGLPTLYALLKRHQDFQEAVSRGKAVADELMEQALFKRGLGFSHPDTHFSTYEGDVTSTPFTRHYPPDTNACIFWLKNRKPKEWRDRTELHVEAEIAGVPPEVVEGLRKRFLASFSSNGNGNGH